MKGHLAEFDMTGRVVMVTGGAKSIGLACSVILAQAGADIALVGRDRSALDVAAVEVRRCRAHARALVLPCDVAQPDSMEEAVTRCCDELGNPDVLVANAGVFQTWMPSENLSMEEWDRVVSVDLRGMWASCRAAGRVMLATGSGSVVTVGSIAGIRGMPHMAAYNAAKAGVVSVTKTLAAEWASRGVRVNCVAPGFVERDVEPLRDDEDTWKRIEGRTPLGRFGRPREVATAVLFLASDASSYVTGATLAVDGGWTAV